MKKANLTFLSLLLMTCISVSGQTPADQDTTSYGNLVIITDPPVLRVEIPLLGINRLKTTNPLVIKDLPPAKYPVGLFSFDESLNYEVVILPKKESRLIADLKNQKVKVVETDKKLYVKAKSGPGRSNDTTIEKQPEFPGGDEARVFFLQQNLQYPDAAKENGIQGKVYVTFVVETDGSLTDIRILRGIGGGCDEEVIRVMKLMPKWIPGTTKGIPVRVQFNLPMKFTLQGGGE
jgi:TonB family protein